MTKILRYDEIADTFRNEGGSSIKFSDPNRLLVLRRGMSLLEQINFFYLFVNDVMGDHQFYLKDDWEMFYRFLIRSSNAAIFTISDSDILVQNVKDKFIMQVKYGNLDFNRMTDEIFSWGLVWQFIHRCTNSPIELQNLIIVWSDLDFVPKEQGFDVPFKLPTMPFFQFQDLKRFCDAMRLYIEDNEHSIDCIKELAVDYTNIFWSSDENRIFWSDLLIAAICDIVTDKKEIAELHDYMSNQALRWAVQISAEDKKLWTK